MFSAAELGAMLCGERVIDWDREALEKHLKLVSNEQVRMHLQTAHFFEIRVSMYVHKPHALG
jgi:hypothetical protein